MKFVKGEKPAFYYRRQKNSRGKEEDAMELLGEILIKWNCFWGKTNEKERKIRRSENRENSRAPETCLKRHARRHASFGRFLRPVRLPGSFG